MGLEALGLSMESMPKIANTYNGTLVICSSGRCVWDDLEKFGWRPDWKYKPSWDQFDVMCINDMIMHFPGRITHVYSNDHKMIPNWVHARRPRYTKEFQENLKIHTWRMVHSSYHGWPWPGHGTSSLNAVYTGLGLGYSDIVLCGIPLDDSGHYFDPPWVETNFTRQCPERDGEPKYWGNAAKRVFEGKVRSMSGRTKELINPNDP